jgi:hypothetical protein
VGCAKGLLWPLIGFLHKFHNLLHQIIDTGGHAGLYPAHPNALILGFNADIGAE